MPRLRVISPYISRIGLAFRGSRQSQEFRPGISELLAVVELEAAIGLFSRELDNPVEELSLSSISSHLFIFSRFPLLLLRCPACSVDIRGHNPTWTPRPSGPGRRQHSEMRQLHIGVMAGFAAFTGASRCRGLDALGLPPPRLVWGWWEDRLWCPERL